LADIASNDNALILKLIEGRARILDLLNEECTQEAESNIKNYKRMLEITLKSEGMKIQEEYALLKQAFDEKQAEEDGLRK
jgi:hypothetical protein